MIVSSRFDSANIRAVDASDADNIQLKINADNASDFMQ